MSAVIVITGAAGFVGRACVAAARAAGHPVRAVVRRDHDLPAEWDEGVEVHQADLAKAPDLSAVLADACAVIHAAAGAGDSHAADTQDATAHLIAAMTGQGARLVLVSSLSVYGYAAIPDHATLDETTPPDPDMARRDAYARAKYAQEMQGVAAAQHHGLDLWILRPGAIYGPDRLWSARLGYPKGGRMLVPGGDVPVPAIHVESCAAGLVAACTAARPARSDLPVIAGTGSVSTVNLIDPALPHQRDWLEAIGKTSVTALPLSLLMKMARGLDLAGDLWPAFGRRLPVGLREATLAARFKPLRYSRARAEDWLGHHPATDFKTHMQSLTGEAS
ncbi:NAD-dependent epimerase/dehydratase family protein [Roseobacter litoralis]|uniref:NAD-dependent epimerase/dehydratase family protein n=1 Tax=Roseobacter litoralis TaxID=42443 RepID=UPI0024953A69|nr:NAD-dependent epimerase/dehydratase family protein [Roseobacter litoralis]